MDLASQTTDEYPFGFGRAETLAAAAMSLLLIGGAIGIAIEAIREIVTPHHLPAPWTLAVLMIVILVKYIAARRVDVIGAQTGSLAVRADAWHHFSDAVTSAAAFIGISIALWGGPGWEPADDWAALVCAGVIAYNGTAIFRMVMRDLMDVMPGADILNRIRDVAGKVEGVLAIEKVIVRRTGLVYHVAIHVQAAGSLSLSESHSLGGRVKAELRQAIPNIGSVVVHMEPFGE